MIHAGAEEISAELCARVAEVHGRFVEEFVEGRGWCPFARPARRVGTSEFRVLWVGADASAPLKAWAPLGDWLQEFAGGSLEILQVVCPLIKAPPRVWERRTRELLDEFQAGLSRSAIAMAAFHPELEVRHETGPGIIPLLRRSPMPMIQFVRLDALERVREGRSGADVFVAPGSPEFFELINRPVRKPLGRAIVDANFEQVNQEGMRSVEQALRALADEAKDLIARVGRPAVVW